VYLLHTFLTTNSGYMLYNIKLLSKIHKKCKHNHIFDYLKTQRR